MRSTWSFRGGGGVGRRDDLETGVAPRGRRFRRSLFVSRRPRRGSKGPKIGRFRSGLTGPWTQRLSRPSTPFFL